MFGTLGIVFNFYAIDKLVLSDANMLNKISPFLVVIFSAIFLKEKISVSTSRKKKYIKEINNKKYSCFPVYYPIGNGRFNIDKSIEDILWIMHEELEKVV